MCEFVHIGFAKYLVAGARFATPHATLSGSNRFLRAVFINRCRLGHCGIFGQAMEHELAWPQPL